MADQDVLLEVRELLESCSTELLRLERAPDNRASLDALFRALHTAKGVFGLMEQRPLVQLAHAAEDRVDQLRGGSASLTAELVDVLLEVLDVLASGIDGIEYDDALPADFSSRAQQLVATLHGQASQEPLDEDAPPPPAWAIAAAEGTAATRALEWIPDDGCFFAAVDPVAMVRSLEGIDWLRVSLVEPVGPEGPDALFDTATCGLRIRALGSWSGGVVRDALAGGHLTSWPLAQAPRPEAVASESAPAWRPPTTIDTHGILLHAQQAILAQEQSTEAVGAGTVAMVRHVCTILAPQMGLAPPSPDAGRDALSAWVMECLAPPVEDAAAPEAPSLGTVEDAPATREDRTPTVLRVDQARIDVLMDLVGELIVAKNGLPYLSRRAEREFGTPELGGEIRTHHAVVNRIADALYDAVMRVRMVPLGHTFQRFPRLVRQLARKLDKAVSLEIQGEDVEADKNIVEALGEPLVHLVRNSLDHGLESREERRAAGKPEEGQLLLRASQNDDHVLIEITDDGAGIDADKVRAKAMARGLISQDDVLTTEQLHNLILRPGFSTSQEVSAVSGRGVGLDAVAAAVRHLGGKLSISSEPGQGTTMALTLPVSMAISRVMVVEVAGRRLGVPISHTREAVRVPRSEIQRTAGGEVIVLRGQMIPLVHLRELLRLPRADQDEDEEISILVTRVGGQVLGVGIDRLHEDLDVLLKPLKGIMAKYTVYAGSALMGDGSVLLVLNLTELIDERGDSRTGGVPLGAMRSGGGGSAAGLIAG